MELTKEITFNANCQICSKKDVPCRKHHLVPQRLLNILPIKNRKKWEHLKVVACDKCNRYFHPENKLYQKISVLENKLGFQHGKG